MEWLNLSLEIQDRAGVELEESAIERIESVRDLLQAVADATERVSEDGSLFEDPESVLSASQRRWVRPRGPVVRALARVGFAINRVVMRLAFRVRAEGASRALEDAGDGPLVLAPNHLSYLDPFALAAVLPAHLRRRLWWAGVRERAFANPLTRFVSRLSRTVPIDPAGGTRSSLAFGALVLQRGDALVWFPEGQRSATGELQDLRPGLGTLLEHVPATVVPVVIEGSHEALPPHRRWPRLSRIRLRFQEPRERLAGAT